MASRQTHSAIADRRTTSTQRLAFIRVRSLASTEHLRRRDYSTWNVTVNRGGFGPPRMTGVTVSGVSPARRTLNFQPLVSGLRSCSRVPWNSRYESSYMTCHSEAVIGGRTASTSPTRTSRTWPKSSGSTTRSAASRADPSAATGADEQLEMRHRTATQPMAVAWRFLGVATRAGFRSGTLFFSLAANDFRGPTAPTDAPGEVPRIARKSRLAATEPAIGIQVVFVWWTVR